MVMMLLLEERREIAAGPSKNGAATENLSSFFWGRRTEAAQGNSVRGSWIFDQLSDVSAGFRDASVGTINQINQLTVKTRATRPCC